MSSETKGSTLLRSEDWLAVWLGFLTIGAVLIGVCPQLSKFTWALDTEVISAAHAVKPTVDQIESQAEAAGAAALSSAAAALKTALVGHSTRRLRA